MRYAQFRIKNFKGIDDLELKLDQAPHGNIFAFVGLNESGKTTLLEAIDFFSKVIDAPANDSVKALELAGASKSKNDFREAIPIGKVSDFSDSISVSSTVRLDDRDIELITNRLKMKEDFHLEYLNKDVFIEQRASFVHSKKSESDRSYWTINFVGQKNNERIENPNSKTAIWQAVVKEIKAQLSPIQYFPNFLFDFPDRIYISGSKAKEEINQFYSGIIQDILSSKGEGLNLDEHVVDRLNNNRDEDRLVAEQLLFRVSQKLTKEYFSTWEAIIGRKLVGQQLKILHRGGGRANSSVYLEFFLEDSSNLFKVSQRSLGFRWFFAFWLHTHFRVQREGGKQPVFLFDEPASNLHASAQSELLKSFEHLAERSTILYSTHSHYLINPSWLENVFVVKNKAFDNDEELKERHNSIFVERYRSFASKHPDQTTYFQPVLDTLDYRPSSLELVPEVVMFEGKNDFYMAKLASFVSDKKLSFLPGGGAGALGESIRLYIAWARNFLVVLDSDEEGDAQRKRYIELFGELLSPRIVLLNELNPAWEEIESLFEDDDALALQQVAFPNDIKFHKNRFYKSLQGYILRRESPDLSEKTRINLKQLLSKLEERIEELRGTSCD